ncbi:MAG: IS1 family transposase [Euryarchaeota archaeon]|nr:IS1 family transposase [Euryarchaeota archaeon]
MAGDLVLELFIPDEEKALNIFRCIRWADGVYCPECKSFDIYKRGFTDNKKVRRYSCNNCGKNFTDFTGTIFANKHLPLGEMFYIIANQDKKSTNRLSEELGHKWESVYRISNEFKECLAEKSKDPVLSGEINIDEMYQSAGNKGLKKTSTNKKAQIKKNRHL